VPHARATQDDSHRRLPMDTLDKAYAPVVVEDEDDIGSNRSRNRPFLEIYQARLSRRTMLKGFVTTAAMGAIGGTVTSRVALAAAEHDPSTLTFEQPPHEILDDHQVAPGYSAKVLIRWGDPVLPGAPKWDPMQQTAEAQAGQFGYNNDFVAYMPLPRGSDNSEHGLVHVNHEYTNPELMFPGWVKDGEDDAAARRASVAAQTPEQSAIEMMAHGGSVIEVIKENGSWRVVEDSEYARRITPETEMRISGPAAGHDRMKTGYDPTGTRVFGTFNNCAGGKTPWGTVLMAEENFHGYFGGGDPENAPEAANYKRYGVGATARRPWHRSVDRFDLGKEPNEVNRFGWMVEYDPYDPNSMPVKRTALGRFKHEGAMGIVNRDGRYVLYQGDDERFDYLYRFITAGTVDGNDPEANRDLLDEGTLYVARFDEEKLTWLPLVFGEGPLTPENGFNSQADVLIETRRAADLLGATPMDRPEEVEVNPVNGYVYVMLTNNSRRTEEQVDAVNPRADNRHGQVVELLPPDGDHTAEVFGWEMFLLAGRPEEDGATYHPASTVWLSSPDNCAFDPQGRLWISTDQGTAQTNQNFIPDGMYACDVDGEGRALIRFFYGCPRGAEMCGPEFTPDGRTLFVAPQHPAEEDELAKSNFENPTTRWPDFQDGVPPRPSLVVITKDDGGPIGS
jgi:uncharacterized protein